MVVFDATILLPILWPDVPVPKDPATGQPVSRFRDRIDYLVKTLEQSKSKIIIPTPALSEILVRSGDAGPEFLAQITAASAFRIAPFDTKAAVEVAAMTHDFLNSRERRRRGNQTIAKLKYDRQIVGIAKAEGASTIYSDDEDLKRFATTVDVSVIRTCDLPLPPDEPQSSFMDELHGDAGGEKTDDDTR